MTKDLDQTNAREKGHLLACSSKGIQSSMVKDIAAGGEGRRHDGRSKWLEGRSHCVGTQTAESAECMLLLNSLPLLTQNLRQGRYGHSGQVFPPLLAQSR